VIVAAVAGWFIVIGINLSLMLTENTSLDARLMNCYATCTKE
jgi:hypothetical protein